MHLEEIVSQDIMLSSSLHSYKDDDELKLTSDVASRVTLML